MEIVVQAGELKWLLVKGRPALAAQPVAADCFQIPLVGELQDVGSTGAQTCRQPTERILHVRNVVQHTHSHDGVAGAGCDRQPVEVSSDQEDTRGTAEASLGFAQPRLSVVKQNDLLIPVVKVCKAPVAGTDL